MSPVTVAGVGNVATSAVAPTGFRMEVTRDSCSYFKAKASPTAPQQRVPTGRRPRMLANSTRDTISPSVSVSLLSFYLFNTKAGELAEVESLSADNGCAGRASAFKTQGRRSHDSCSWTARVVNAGSVGPSSHIWERFPNRFWVLSAKQLRSHMG